MKGMHPGVEEAFAALGGLTEEESPATDEECDELPVVAPVLIPVAPLTLEGAAAPGLASAIASTACLMNLNSSFAETNCFRSLNIRASRLPIRFHIPGRFIAR